MTVLTKAKKAANAKLAEAIADKSILMIQLSIVHTTNPIATLLSAEFRHDLEQITEIVLNYEDKKAIRRATG
ncbi:hypothetical protein LCGC14_0781790 [marine sediment metagenome]|uniref:Uncharacterized protein n=1 Tax=marine sediment metagenome TaxID=412755 RepID=A0A0F9QF41_9ZZZZ